MKHVADKLFKQTNIVPNWVSQLWLFSSKLDIWMLFCGLCRFVGFCIQNNTGKSQTKSFFNFFFWGLTRMNIMDDKGLVFMVFDFIGLSKQFSVLFLKQIFLPAKKKHKLLTSLTILGWSVCFSVALLVFRVVCPLAFFYEFKLKINLIKIKNKKV